MPADSIDQVLPGTDVDVDVAPPPSGRVHFFDDRQEENRTLCGLQAPEGWWHPECKDERGHFPISRDFVCPSCFRPICNECQAIYRYLRRYGLR